MAKSGYHSALFDFAFFPHYDAKIKELAESIADRENWDYSDSSTKNYSILKNYLEFTYRKLKSETGKIIYTKDNKFACFNTGLVSTNLEDIFALFEEYKNPKPGGSPFFFNGFVKKSDYLLLKHFSQQLPDTADYFANPEHLLFNPKNALIPDIDHIIQDNIGRFPAHLQVADDADRRRQLIGAIEEVKKKVKTNYKLAVPQYFNNQIQLLLPLCLTSGSTNPDLALVVSRLNDTTYTARTCLTLKMAYGNARLIVKPQSNWLRP